MPVDHDVVSWDKPGPGTWLLDSSHCRPAPGPIVQELLKVGIERGLARIPSDTAAVSRISCTGFWRKGRKAFSRCSASSSSPIFARAIRS